MMTHADWMRRALALARLGEGCVNPNPLVGAIVVRSGKDVGHGYHARFGGPHAEVHALARAGRAARGATIYVTLEPCCHHGKTPPCTEAIVEAGVARVVIACRDPNPLVAGGGVTRLREAGIDVVVGVREAESRRLNEAFEKHVRTGLPFVHLKLAVTLDGRIATRTGDAKWISGATSRRLVHRWRRAHAAVAVGVGTVLADDPQLTVRLVRGRQPHRFVLDAHGEMPATARLLSEPGKTTILVAQMSSERERELVRAGATVWRLPSSHGELDLAEAWRRMGTAGIDSVLVEGGANTSTRLLQAGWGDRLSMFVSPQIVGDGGSLAAFGDLGIARMADAVQLDALEIRRVGRDVLISGIPRGRNPERREEKGIV
ncbi:bifunctional diaminohydroxyphosphoribosylaminopyrimidine deaminase/5-amino-6-(5-phosphoribosylamino)uracil reductase RibD [Candidatus Bipolaricaulota bacterium]|nr:bifunctional diaminohydroxyphosphoribosylaminopyrimidine deaminase/5-amino-6-(5-phosphoribosylamino)uracil reductase RibD [Candidatus Bipolaricaulota bacterium]